MAEAEKGSDRRREVGRRGEELAVGFLVEQGLRILARNVRTRHGEIDILAEDGATLVVVEVRTVSRARFLGHPAAAITLGKARQVLRATRHYLARSRLRGKDVRIDALGVELATGRIEHLPGAIRWDMELASSVRRRERGW